MRIIRNGRNGRAMALAAGLTTGLTTGLATGLALAGPAMAQEVPRQIPPLDTTRLNAQSFDVRGFDPLAGQAPAPPIASRMASSETPSWATMTAPPAAERMGRLMSEGWSRDGFAARRD